MTNDEMEPFIAAARESKRIRERGGWTRPAQCTVIVALAERVAKLERDAMHCNTCGGRCDGDCEEGDEQSASGQPASAGGATVPTGWKLAPGWRLSSYGADGTGCSGGEDEHWGKSRAAYVRGGMFDRTGACAAHAVEMGALVRDEPPAEQQSRQETPVGEPACKDWCGFDGSDGDVVCMFDEERHAPPCVTGDRECVCRCSQACTGRRDRAKAKREGGSETGEATDWSRFLLTEEIPEDMALVAYNALTRGDVFASWDLVHGGNVNRSLGIDRAETLAGGGCWWQRRVRLIRHANGRWADGYHGPSVDATGAATEFEAGPCRPDCGSSDGCKSKPCFFVHAGKTYHFCTPFCRARFEADRAKAKAAEQAHPSVNFTYPEATCLCRGDGSKCHHGSCQLPEQSGTGQLPGAPVGFRVVRESGPDVPIPTDDTMIVFARYSHDRHDTGNEPRRADDGRQTDRRLWDAGCYDILEPIAEPPAPAVGTRGDVDGNASCSTCGYPPRWCECSVPPDDCVKLTTAEGRVAALEARLAQAEERVKRQTDWYQQRFNRLRKWVDEEVRPLSADVATRYFSICANGSPAPHESADWTDTMHALRLQLAQAERERDERGRQVEQMAEHVAAMRVERDAAVALLRDGDTGCDGSDDGDDDPPCWGCRASALLSRIENVHG